MVLLRLVWFGLVGLLIAGLPGGLGFGWGWCNIHFRGFADGFAGLGFWWCGFCGLVLCCLRLVLVGGVP